MGIEDKSVMLVHDYELLRGIDWPPDGVYEDWPYHQGSLASTSERTSLYRHFEEANARRQETTVGGVVSGKLE
jgi:hypothetical protein